MLLRKEELENLRIGEFGTRMPTGCFLIPPGEREGEMQADADRLKCHNDEHEV